MALRVADKTGTSDVGRQRDANEDSFVVLAAGVRGGRRHGRRAGRRGGLEHRGQGLRGRGLQGAGTPEQRLTALVREANRRIFEMALADDSKRGMGTTLTAALVEGDGVTVAHVGDSRAYRMRGGDLEQLTHDHSLVAELERSGRISPEDAEHHPQRSIITRALGPEPDVEVDAHTHVRPPRRPLRDLLRRPHGHDLRRRDGGDPARHRARSEEAAESLVKAANQSGGKDNITVVLFSVEEGETAAPAADASARRPSRRD